MRRYRGQQIVGVRLSERQIREIDMLRLARCKTRVESRSEVIRAAIDAYMRPEAEELPPAAAAPKKGRRGSKPITDLAGLAKHLAPRVG